MEKIVMEPNTGCWLWIGGTNGRRYGKFWVDGKDVPAHRASWKIYRGAIPVLMDREQAWQEAYGIMDNEPDKELAEAIG